MLDDPGGARVLGEPGVGKTEICNAILEAYSPTDTGGECRRPVVCVHTDSETTSNQIGERILEALDYPFAKRTTKKDKFDLLDDAIGTSATKLILFEEFSHVGEGGGVKRAYAIADFIKCSYDKVKVAMMFFGGPALDKVFLGNLQVASRMSNRELLERFKCDEYFLGVLDAFDEALPLGEKSGLATLATAVLIHSASRGEMRRIKKLLKRAVYEAALQGLPHLTRPILERAFDRVFGLGSLDPNPFRTADSVVTKAAAA